MKALRKGTDQRWGGDSTGTRDRKESLSPPPPGDNRGVIHERDSSNNGARGGGERFLRSHVVQATAALADEPGRAAG